MGRGSDDSQRPTPVIEDHVRTPDTVDHICLHSNSKVKLQLIGMNMFSLPVMILGVSWYEDCPVAPIESVAVQVMRSKHIVGVDLIHKEKFPGGREAVWEPTCTVPP